MDENVNWTSVRIVSYLLDYTQSLADLAEDALDREKFDIYKEYMFAAKVVYNIAEEIHTGKYLEKETQLESEVKGGGQSQNYS